MSESELQEINELQPEDEYQQEDIFSFKWIKESFQEPVIYVGLCALVLLEVAVGLGVR
jgi:hypothetical protein